MSNLDMAGATATGNDRSAPSERRCSLSAAIEIVRRAGYTVIEAPPLSPINVRSLWSEAEEYARRQRPGRAP
jgi:hypothetical protein